MELLVVFLGVTAGFLLNNWSIERDVRDLEAHYVSSFLIDVDSNIAEIEGFTREDSIWLRRAQPVLGQLQAKSLPLDSAKTVISMILNISSFEARQGTYEDIINSGNLNILQNFELKSTLSNYKLNIEGAQFINSYSYDYFNTYVMPFVFEEIDLANGRIIDSNVLNEVRFSNVFAGYISMIQQRNAAYIELLRESKNLKRMLLEEQEL